MNSASAMVEISLENFQAEVLERSRSTPVLLDFWATWCGPCKTLGPLLEKLAGEARGAFVLAKADIDRLPELADAFGVQSVPTVVLVKGGEVADAFVGAQPEAKIREFLARHVAPAVDRLAQAAELERQGKRAEAIAALREELRSKTHPAEAMAQLARLLALEGADAEAQARLDALSPEERELDAARAASALLALRAQRTDLVALRRAVEQDGRDLAARLALGRALLSAGEHAEALEQLYRVAQSELGFQGGEPRKALIEAFGVLGEADPLTKEYRRKLSLLICS